MLCYVVAGLLFAYCCAGDKEVWFVGAKRLFVPVTDIS